MLHQRGHALSERMHEGQGGVEQHLERRLVEAGESLARRRGFELSGRQVLLHPIASCTTLGSRQRDGSEPVCGAWYGAGRESETRLPSGLAGYRFSACTTTSATKLLLT